MMSTSKSSHFEINYHAKTEMQAIPFPQNSWMFIKTLKSQKGVANLKTDFFTLGTLN